MKTYTAQHHQQAFDIWYRTRNWTEVARELKAEWTTAKRWSAADFDCKWNCPWHNWVALQEERDNAQATRNALLNNGVTDPVVHDMAMRDVLLGKDTDLSPRKKIAQQMIRSDNERISHWEYLWSKVYFDATGIALDWRQARGMDDRDIEEKLRETLRVGLHATSLEQCVKMLKIIQEQIDTSKGNMVSITPISSIAATEDLSIDELRQLRTQLKKTPPAKLKALNIVLDDQDAPPETATG